MILPIFPELVEGQMGRWQRKVLTEGYCGEAETPPSRPDGRSTSPIVSFVKNGKD